MLASTAEEMEKLKIEQFDVILVTGDAYVDHPSFGTAIIGNVLSQIAGLNVGVISQPDWKNAGDISRLGRPKYFFGITAGNVDSMVANYTASRKKRKTDEYTPDAQFGKRPDRACVVYSNLIKGVFHGIPIILGGIEASLRRLAHYDWWQNRVKKSVLLDSKADLIVYGMGEKTILQIAEIFKNGGNIRDCTSLRGTVYWSSALPQNTSDFTVLPSFETVSENKNEYMKMFKEFSANNDPYDSKGLIQKHDNRYVVQNRPQLPLSQHELDRVYGLDYTRKVHPFCLSQGYVKGIDTVRFSITSHRGCYGGCSFCAITLHQGRIIQSRSISSILREAEQISKDEKFNGYISDIGGPTANMYGHDCLKKLELGSCKEKQCIGDEVCHTLNPSHKAYIDLLSQVEKLPFIKKVFISSGIRLDLIYADKKYGMAFLRRLVELNTSGQIKIAPEHASPNVLRLMNKHSFEIVRKFISDYESLNKELNKNQFFSAYLIAAHPGAELQDEVFLRKEIEKYFGFSPQQVQIFTPTPGTMSTAVYYTELDPFSSAHVFVEKDDKKRKMHKDILLGESNAKKHY